MKRAKIAVIGIGDFGAAIARRLTQKGADVLAIDADTQTIEAIADDVAYCVAIDATDAKALMAQEITAFDAVVVAIGQNFEHRLLVVAQLLDLGVKRIIARATGKNQRKIMEKLGIQEILSPEEEVGALVAERLLMPSVFSQLQLPDDYSIVEVAVPDLAIQRSVADIDLRNRYNLNLITLKLKNKTQGSLHNDYHIVGVPDPNYIFSKDDRLVLFGTDKDIQRFFEVND